MIRRTFLTLAFMISVLYVRGYEINWSKELPDNGRFPSLKILGTYDNGYYILRSNIDFDEEGIPSGRTRRFLLIALSEALIEQWEVEIVPVIADSKILDVQLLDGKVLVTSYSDRTTGSGYEIRAQFIGSDGKFIGTPVLIEEFPDARFDSERRPSVTFSKDGSKIALCYRRSTENELSQLISVIVLDSAFQRQYKREWTIASPIRRFSPTEFVITNEGSFYLLGVQYQTDKRVKEPGESYFLLTGYDPASDRQLNREIRLENKFLTNVSIAVDAINRKIVVAGLYSEIGMLASAGVFYCGMTADSLSYSNVYWAPFTNDLLTKAISDRGDPKKKELFNYYVDRLILRKDGGAAIIAESYVETTRTFWDYYTQTVITHTYYRYGNILLASINPDGGMLWNRLIQKEQNSMDDNGNESSYCSMISGGKIFTVFNKYIDRRSSVMITRLDGTGALQTDVLFQESERISVIARAARQVDEHTLLLPALRQGEYYIAKITF
jgi:hypothetical protein